MSATPLLSVLMPAFNAAATVREAIESALDNGCGELEVLVIDDGSTDNTAETVAAIRHPALRLESNPRNLGVGATRRRGVALARGRFLAMLDADDIAVPGRFDAQLRRLTAADGPDIIGGGIEFFGDGSGTLLFPCSDAEIRTGLMFFDLPMCNGAACMKAEPLLNGGVNYGAFAGAEDYALWADALIAGLRFENLPQVVTKVRRHAGSLTRASRDRVFEQGCLVRRRIVEFLFPSLGAAGHAALVAALSFNLGGGQRWIDGVNAMAHAVVLAPAVPRIDAERMRLQLEARLVAMIGHARDAGAIDNETLEMMTETNPHFEQWRNARNGALDRQIMALFA